MGYYCTVPQCTSLAGKTKNVKFHRFPRDTTMADKWNEILKRGKPYTKYSKVCSLHFTQADYNVTTMGKKKGQWKTLSKDAVPSQNLPKLHPDGSVMVIRKSRTLKYKETREKAEKPWMPLQTNSTLPLNADGLPQHIDNSSAYRLQTLSAVASALSSQPNPVKPKKQDAFMQTDPVQYEEDDSQPNNSYSETSENSYSNIEYDKNYMPAKDGFYKDKEWREEMDYQKERQYEKREQYDKNVPQDRPIYDKELDFKYEKIDFEKEREYKNQMFEKTALDYQKNRDQLRNDDYEAKDFSKQDDYIPTTNEEYNKEAEKYALERKNLPNYEKTLLNYEKNIPSFEKSMSHYEKDIPSYVKNPNYEKNVTNYPKSLQSYEKNLPTYEKNPNYDKSVLDYKSTDTGYQKVDYLFDKDYHRNDYLYQNNYQDSVEILRNQQNNLEILQQQHRNAENQNFFNENHIKQEIDLNGEDDKFLYERSKEQLEANSAYAARVAAQRLDLELHHVKQEPDQTGCDTTMQPQGSPYYGTNGHTNISGAYYDSGCGASRPGPELLIAKQNALAAHAQLWQNTMKRPFFYSDNPPYAAPQLLHRYEMP